MKMLTRTVGTFSHNEAPRESLMRQTTWLCGLTLETVGISGEYLMAFPTQLDGGHYLTWGRVTK